MLTEVDTRKVANAEVSLYMDTDAKVYLVCVEGYEPITCLTRDRAVAAYRHPYAYIPLEGHRIDSNGTQGGSEGQESFQGLSETTASLLVSLKDTLMEMGDSDFNWTVSLLAEITQNMARERRQEVPKPYDREADGPDIPFV